MLEDDVTTPMRVKFLSFTESSPGCENSVFKFHAKYNGRLYRSGISFSESNDSLIDVFSPTNGWLNIFTFNRGELNQIIDQSNLRQQIKDLNRSDRSRIISYYLIEHGGQQIGL